MHRNLQKLLRSVRVVHGFSLIELAIVLTLFGVIISGVWLMIGTAMRSQKQNRVSQQIISMVENARSYARRVDNSTLALTTTDFCNLGLLPKDIGGASTSPCPAAGTYVDAFSGNSFIDGCIAGGANTLTGVCGANANSPGIGIYLQNLASADCTTILTKLTSGVSDLGFTEYWVGANAFPTSTAANLTLTNIAANCTLANGNNTVSLELDFSF